MANLLHLLNKTNYNSCFIFKAKLINKPNKQKTTYNQFKSNTLKYLYINAIKNNTNEKKNKKLFIIMK